MTHRRPALWIYKNNANGQDVNESWGDWAGFFASPKPQRWGGTWMSNHAKTLNLLRDEVAFGDYFLTWQVDRGLAIGYARYLKRAAIEVGADGKEEFDIWLEPYEVFTRPVPILKLRKSDPDLARVRAFQQGYGMGTICEVAPKEERAIRRACSAFSSSRVLSHR